MRYVPKYMGPSQIIRKQEILRIWKGLPQSLLLVCGLHLHLQKNMQFDWKIKRPGPHPSTSVFTFRACLDLKHLAHRSWQHHRSFSLGKCFVIHWRVLWDICGLNECRFLGCRYQETMSIEDILHGHFPKHHPYRTIMYELKAKDWDQCKIFFMSSLLYHPTSRSFMVESVLVVVFSRKRLNFSWEATMLPVFFALKLNCDEKQVHWKVSWLNGS